MYSRRFTVVALSSLLMLLSAFPAFAGTWTEHDDGTWTYLNDDGESCSESMRSADISK